MPDAFFFGYGSLVNRSTHDYADARRARVRGWRRQWRHTRLRDVAYLTVAPAPAGEIEGLIAAVPGNDWQLLDQREHAYDRLHLDQGQVDHDHAHEILVHMYRTKPGNDAAPSVRNPILLSYLDTVLCGYLDLFGTAGVDRFFATTDGWDSPVLDDRKNPVYGRAVVASAARMRLIDQRLDDHAVRRIRQT